MLSTGTCLCSISHIRRTGPDTSPGCIRPMHAIVSRAAMAYADGQWAKDPQRQNGKGPVGKRTKTTRGSRLRRLLAGLRRWIFRLVLGAAALITVWVAAYAILPVPTTPYILSERMRLGAVERAWVPIDDIAIHLQRAVVAAEDAQFLPALGLRHGRDPRRHRRGRHARRLHHQSADGEERVSLARQIMARERRWRPRSRH